LSTPDDLIEELRLAALRVRNAQADAPAGSAFANYKRALKEHCPAEFVDAVATFAYEAANAVQADEKHDERKHERAMAKADQTRRNIAGVIGIAGFVGLLWLSFYAPNPTAAQMSNFRLMRALCGGAMLGGLAGTLTVKAKVSGFAIEATSAVAGVVVFYFFY
jgi:hypothetical protein